MRNINNKMVINVRVEIIIMFMLKYFRGYHRSTKINLNEYLTHEIMNDFHMKNSQFTVVIKVIIKKLIWCFDDQNLSRSSLNVSTLDTLTTSSDRQFQSLTTLSEKSAFSVPICS